MIGVKVRKKFDSDWFDGEVISVTGPGLYKVRYEERISTELSYMNMN